jgi:hypothetical protein
MLPMQSCSSLASIPQSEKMILFVRHAERTEITDNRVQASAMLTEKGRADSEIFGRILGKKFGHLSIWHSPITRCRDTAECMVRGMMETTPEVKTAGPLTWLGGDFFNNDPDWINSEVAGGVDHFYHKWTCGCYSANQIMPMKDAAEYELENAILQMEKSDSSVIIDIIPRLDCPHILILWRFCNKVVKSQYGRTAA